MLRSASSPALNPRAPQKPAVPRSATTTRTATARPVSASSAGVKLPILRASSQENLMKLPAGIPVPENKTTTDVYFETTSPKVLEIPVFGGGLGSSGGGGGRSCGGGGGGGGEESVGGYYEEMITRYPGDSLLLANYARFLKEVEGDERKAEEYCERAIITAEEEEKGKDGNLLAMYGGLMWKNHKDSVRALSYFHQAVQSSPRDCYVLASYAEFLWDAEEDEDEDEDEDGEINYQTQLSQSYASTTVVSS